MKFKDLKLLVAIRGLETGRDPQSEHNRLEFARTVQHEYADLYRDTCFPWTVNEVCEIAAQLRKNTNNKLKADIASAHGYKCFWSSRAKGPCSDDVEAGHVIAAKTGAPLSVENGMIECRSHNNQRRDRTIEDYLKSDDVTPCPG